MQKNRFVFLIISIFSLIKVIDITPLNIGKDPQLRIPLAVEQMEISLVFSSHLKIGKLPNKVKANMPFW